MFTYCFTKFVVENDLFTNVNHTYRSFVMNCFVVNVYCTEVLVIVYAKLDTLCNGLYDTVNFGLVQNHITSLLGQCDARPTVLL